MESDAAMKTLRQQASDGTSCLIVLAHPRSDSLAAALAREAMARAAAKGWHVVLRDLASAGFDPAMTGEERGSYYAPRYAGQAVSALAAELQAADVVILVYPTWWFGFPALLKGWFDRVWSPGVAFEHGAYSGPIRPGLGQLRHVLAVTTLGSPWWVDWLVLHRALARSLKRGIVGPCAPKARFRYLSLYGVEAMSAARLSRFRARLGRAIDRMA